MCMDRATLCRVDAGRVDARMTEDVSQPGKVMVDEVEQPDKKMPQIMSNGIKLSKIMRSWYLFSILTSLLFSCHRLKSMHKSKKCTTN